MSETADPPVPGDKVGPPGVASLDCASQEEVRLAQTGDPPDVSPTAMAETSAETGPSVVPVCPRPEDRADWLEPPPMGRGGS